MRGGLLAGAKIVKAVHFMRRSIHDDTEGDRHVIATGNADQARGLAAEGPARSVRSRHGRPAYGPYGPKVPRGQIRTAVGGDHRVRGGGERVKRETGNLRSGKRAAETVDG